MDDTKFAQFFWPDFLGLSYGENTKDGSLIIAPYFDDMKKAEHVSNEISKWNPNFIKVRFLEYGQDEYAFIAYQDPQGSYDKLNFALYRSSMKRHMNYSRFVDRFESEPSKIGVFFSEDPSNPNSFRPVGNFLRISECKILSESDLPNYPLEEAAHRICKGNNP